MHSSIHSKDFHRQQLRLAIGGEAFDAIPDAPDRRSNPGRVPSPSVQRRAVQRRPRTEARIRIVQSGYAPAKVLCGFTLAEQAVLCVVAHEHKRHGRCDLTVGELAYMAQCCETVVHNTLRLAAHYGHILVDTRRIARWRNLPNVITIVSRTWLTWLRLGPDRPRPWGGGWYAGVAAAKAARGSASPTCDAFAISASRQGRVHKSAPDTYPFKNRYKARAVRGGDGGTVEPGRPPVSASRGGA